jgi:TRAP-type C4-dicarboxylate transport system permease small subunit
MDTMLGILEKVSKILSVIAGSALTGMMLLTAADVLLRAGGHPIMGTYELVALSLALVIGFSLPSVTLARQQIFMEFFVALLSKKTQAIINTATRILCIVIFLFIGYTLFRVGYDFQTSGEVSPTIELPFFPVAYGVGVCCFLECFVFVHEIARIWRGQYE